MEGSEMDCIEAGQAIDAGASLYDDVTWCVVCSLFGEDIDPDSADGLEDTPIISDSIGDMPIDSA
jgi:hypothetical protein